VAKVNPVIGANAINVACHAVDSFIEENNEK